ncbi:MAG: hypothetical protein LBD06_04850, partial [Candidatus Accumulibacter sp.]|nr:hypothetical protein [Accumulibacter sp.]
MAGNPNWRDVFTYFMPLMYASGYSCSQYFVDRGIKSLSVYCEEIDYGFGRQICFDLSLSLDVDVKFWLSDAVHKNSPDVIKQDLTGSPNFNPVHIDELKASDNVLILCSERINDMLAKIRSKTEHLYHIADIWTDMWWRSMMVGRFQEIRNLFPFLPIVIFPNPRYPTNKEAYSDIEKYMSE